MLGVCMRSKLKEGLWRSLVENSIQKPDITFEYIDWGLHYYPKVIKNECIIGFHAPIIELGNPKDKHKTCLITLKNIIDEIKG